MGRGAAGLDTGQKGWGQDRLTAMFRGWYMYLPVAEIEYDENGKQH